MCLKNVLVKSLLEDSVAEQDLKQGSECREGWGKAWRTSLGVFFMNKLWHRKKYVDSYGGANQKKEEDLDVITS